MIYLTFDEIVLINQRIVGVTSSLRDTNSLQSATTRPHMAAHYAGADLAQQASVLIEGIAGNHPFLDGNKRTAAVAALLFLHANGYRLYYQQFGPNQPVDEFGDQILHLVMHQITSDEMAAWIRTHLITLP